MKRRRRRSEVEFRGQIIDTEHSGGLNIRQCYQRVFEQNEANWASGDHAKLLTDEAISRLMLGWFPDRHWSRTLVQVGRARCSYNRGEFTDGKRPRCLSHRYDLASDGTFKRVPLRGRKQ
jgi:hypothetical protein